MGAFDLYCSKSGLPMRMIYDNQKILPKEIQKILSTGVFVCDGKQTVIKNYDSYGKFENNKTGETIDVGELIYSDRHKTDLYHKGIEKHTFFTENKKFVEKMFQGQFFDDDLYLQFYKDPVGFKNSLVYHPQHNKHVVKTDKYIEMERSCPRDKTINPATMRSVKVDSKIGKLIMKNKI